MVIDEGFTQKEMLVMILGKLEKLEEKMSDTHILAKATNGKVGLHTKALFVLGGGFLTLAGWFVSLIIS